MTQGDNQNLSLLEKQIEKTLNTIISKEGFITLGLLFISITTLYLWNEFPLSISEQIDSSKFSDFGSFIGTVLAFFTFILVFLTYRSQSKELQEEREQFEHSRIPKVKRSTNEILEFI